MTVRRDYPAAFAAALLLHGLLLAALGRGLTGRGFPPAAPAPAAPLALRLLPAPALTAAAGGPAPAPAEAAETEAAETEAAPAEAAETEAGRPAAPPVPAAPAGGFPPGPERVKPRLTAALEPVFPLASRRRGEEGDVRLRVLLTAAGRVAEVRLLDSSGFPALDRAALRAARLAGYAPALEMGRPVAGELVIRVRFRLEGS